MTTAPEGQPPHTEGHRRTRTAFVGRERDLAALVAALPGPHGRWVRSWLVAGDAGIGKTRLVRELVAVAEAEHQIVWGQCWDETGTPPYWPWTQVIRRLRGATSGSDLARLVLGEVDGDGGSDQFDLFDATAAELDRSARRSPLLVVLDDLHRADPPTLHLTRFLLGHLVDAPVMVVATYRPDDAAARDDIAVLVAALRAQGRQLELGGLGVDEVASLLGDAASAEGVRALTGGNPLFVQQLVRAPSVAPTHTDADRGTLGRVLRARLRGLDAEALDLFAALAVLGPRSAVRPAAALLDTTPARLAPLVDRLRGTGLIDHDGLRLSHPLVAEAAAEVVAPGRLEELHLVAALLGDADGAPAAERAHHWCRAGADRWHQAVEACREAAAVATASFAHDDAAAHLGRAARLLDDHPEALATRFEVAFELAVSVERTKGALAAEDAYRDALGVARQTGDPHLVARAASRHGIAFYADSHAQRDRASDCRAALADLPDTDGALRARLLANLVAADPHDPDRARAADEAVDLARRSGDAETLGVALVAQQLVDLGPSTLHRRLGTSREIVALAERCGETDLAVRGRFLLKNALLEAGDVRELDAELVAQDRTVTEMAEARFARHSLWFRCMRAMLDGRADHTAELADRCLEIGQKLQDPDAFGVYTGQFGVALWLQGRLAELEPIYLDLMRAEPDEPLWPAVVGWIALGDGRPETARGLLEHLPPPAELPQGMHTLLNLFTMADIAAAVGDDGVVTQVRDVLLPYADRAVPVAMGAACFGVVARPLGHLAVRLGRLEEGIAHLERAVAVAARMGARPWLADAQLALAEVLVDADRGDDPRVPVLVAEAAATVTGLELAVFEPRLARLVARATASASARGRVTVNAAATDARATFDAARAVDEVAPKDGTRVARVAVLGTFDVVTVDGETARWTSRKARSLLKILVARRGAPIAREELMGALWPDESPDDLANRMAVAVSTVRRALDPRRSLAVDALVRAEAGSLRLVPDHVEIDVETFLDLGQAALAAHRDGREDAHRLLHVAVDAYHGEALPDEPYEEWAETLRSHVAATYAALLRAVASRAAGEGDPLVESDALRRLLVLDPYDEYAHVGLVNALRSLGAHGQAQAARERYVASMAELGVQLPAEIAGSAARA